MFLQKAVVKIFMASVRKKILTANKMLELDWCYCISCEFSLLTPFGNIRKAKVFFLFLLEDPLITFSQMSFLLPIILESLKAYCLYGGGTTMKGNKKLELTKRNSERLIYQGLQLLFIYSDIILSVKQGHLKAIVQGIWNFYLWATPIYWNCFFQ